MTATIQEQEFWMQVFLAVIRNSAPIDFAAKSADQAVFELRNRTSLKLPAKGDTPTQPNA